MSKKILSLINTKIDLVQETLEKILNKGDMQSDDYSNTTVTTPITESVGSYQSDMNRDNGVDSLSSLSDNASYDNDDVSPAPTLEASGSDATSTEAPGSDATSTEAPGSEAPGSDATGSDAATTVDNVSLPEEGKPQDERPEGGHGQYSQDSFFEGNYYDEKPQKTTGGKRRTNKRNKRRNMKSRRRS